jgi:hypothetical protein
MRAGERLAVLVYCHGGQTWNLIQNVTISSYTLCVKPYFLTKSRIERHWQIIINLYMFDDIQNARKIMSKLHGKLTVRRIFRICHSVLHGE